MGILFQIIRYSANRKAGSPIKNVVLQPIQITTLQATGEIFSHILLFNYKLAFIFASHNAGQEQSMLQYAKNV